MIRITMMIMTSLFSTLFGCNGQSNTETKEQIFPAESFSVLQSELDGKPIIGSINQAYKTFDKKSKYPWCLKVTIGLDLGNLFENGLPKEEESKIACGLEDELLEKIKNLATAHYVGHFYNDTFLDVYVYLDKPEKVNEFLQTQINKKGLVREFGYVITEDPEWATVNGFFK